MRDIKFKIWSKEHKTFYVMDMAIPVGRMSEYASERDWVLCQFTGLLDKNGREIYEGDILQPAKVRKHKFVVAFKSGSFVGIPTPTNPRAISKVCDLGGFIVAGNIFENKDLLK